MAFPTYPESLSQNYQKMQKPSRDLSDAHFGNVANRDNRDLVQF